MKRIKILILTLGLFSVSCELDKTPYDGLTADAQFSSLAGFEGATKGMYSGFRASGYYGTSGHLIISPDILSDNLIFSVEGRQTQKSLFEWRNTPQDEAFPIYGRGYLIVSRANRILDNINNIPQTAQRDRIEAEALAVRAIAHFDIARVHCKIPTQSTDAKTSLGIYYSKTFEPEKKVRRRGITVDDVYKNVIADLEKALTLIGDTKVKGRLDKVSINGILSRVYLYYGDYANAIKYASAVIDAGATIVPREEYSKVWKDEYDKNVLFKIIITDEDRVSIGNAYGQESRGKNRAEYVCSYNLYKLYKDVDIRKTSIFTGEYGSIGKKYNSIAKYFGRSSGDKNTVDGKYLRAEEIYLTRAEALYKSGKETEALSDLNKLRKERYENYTDGVETGEDLWNAIQLERRLELAFEGDRFFTLKRLGQSLKRDDYGHFADGTGTPAIVKEYPADGYRWQLPIPQSAINANPEIGEDQNPGYN